MTPAESPDTPSIREIADADATGNERRTPTRRLDAADPMREIHRLSRELAAARLRYANLLAAARATLSAARDGEPRALAFLADELVAQYGQRDLDDLLGWAAEMCR